MTPELKAIIKSWKEQSKVVNHLGKRFSKSFSELTEINKELYLKGREEGLTVDKISELIK